MSTIFGYPAPNGVGVLSTLFIEILVQAVLTTWAYPEATAPTDSVAQA